MLAPFSDRFHSSLSLLLPLPISFRHMLPALALLPNLPCLFLHPNFLLFTNTHPSFRALGADLLNVVHHLIAGKWNPLGYRSGSYINNFASAFTLLSPSLGSAPKIT